MKPTAYTRAKAMRLIPLLEGIVREVRERQEAIERLETMVEALSGSHAVHAEELRRKRGQLARQRRELDRIAQELADLGCRLVLHDPFEVVIPGHDEAFAWRPGETFLRRATIEPFAA